MIEGGHETVSFGLVLGSGPRTRLRYSGSYSEASENHSNPKAP